MASIEWETTEFFQKAEELLIKIEDKGKEAAKMVAEEIMRLSQFEVPHDTGQLQNSGHIEDGEDGEQIVGYNKVYAARLHENPQYRFQKGRKGKYLEDPIKNNLNIFENFLRKALNL